MKKPYHIVNREAEEATACLQEFTKANGQLLLPLVELISQARLAVDEVIDSIGRQTIETILNLSAEESGGLPHARQEQRRHLLAWMAERAGQFGRPPNPSEAATASP